jgi:hypothetical protein
MDLTLAGFEPESHPGSRQSETRVINDSEYEVAAPLGSHKRRRFEDASVSSSNSIRSLLTYERTEKVKSNI